MKFTSRQDIARYYDRVTARAEDLAPHLRRARDPFEESDIEDVASLLAGGVETVFAPLAAHQRTAYSALQALGPELLVCERTTRNAVDRPLWLCDAFVGAGERYVRVGAYFRGDSIAEAGARSVYWFRYAALPPPIAEAYYSTIAGLEVMDRLPGDPLQSRVLPAMIHVWLRADQVGSAVPPKTMKAGLSAVADPDAVPRPDGLVWKSFACVLDSREKEAQGTEGDLLFVQERSATQRVFHVHDGDFASIRLVQDPVRLYDQYVAWVFAGGVGRFDFCAHSRPA